MWCEAVERQGTAEQSGYAGLGTLQDGRAGVFYSLRGNPPAHQGELVGFVDRSLGRSVDRSIG